MKQYYFKSIILILFISISIYLIWFFLYKNNNQIEKSIFNIYSINKINIGENFWLKGKDFNYNNINYENKIWKWIFIKNNIFLTAKHLFDNTDNKFFIKINNKRYNFKIIKQFKNKDLLIWKINNFNSLNYIKNPIISNLKQNQEIFTYKNWKKIFWKILNTDTTIKELNLSKLIKTDIQLSPWDSWSPLFNSKNELIWIYIIIEKNKNISYAQKISP